MSAVSIPQPPVTKRKLLCWSDSVTAITGFGVVAKHILAALQATGLYEIDQLAINHLGDFHNRSEYPYTLMPARLLDPKDPYGNQMFINALMQNDYDIVLVINDTFVVEGVARKLAEVKEAKLSQNRKVPKFIYYYPIDHSLLPEYSTLIKFVDRPVAYTKFAQAETKKAIGLDVKDVIYHGTDTENFFPLDRNVRREFRARLLGIASDDAFVLINVNRNSLRKDIAKTIVAFAEFKKMMPSSVLYLHTKMQDTPGNSHVIDLGVAVRELGLSIHKDVIFPQNFHPARGFPVQELNLLYNLADVYITTSTGEGWGLTQTDAMLVGLPVIVGDHTTTPELHGKDGERGYVYPCRERVFYDNAGIRPSGRTEDILTKIMQAYGDWKANTSHRSEMIQRSYEWARQHNWKNIGKQWVKLVDDVYRTPSVVPSQLPKAEVL